jgi:O-acetyl-ADP-ribose deacetylase (regulator of RNase III)
MNIIKQDITSVTRGVIAHGCNCQGAFGSGVAGAIRRKWDKAYKSYMKAVSTAHNNGTRLLGSVDFVLLTDEPKLYVANIFSQQYFGADRKRYADPEAIRQGMSTVFQFAEQNSLAIHTVKIGCGLGGVSWEDEVYPIMEQLETLFPIVPIYIYEF